MTESSCAHCGIPVTIRKHVEEDVFCCYGCEIAYALVGSKESASGSSQLALYKFAFGCILGINVMMFSMPLYVESLGSFFAHGLGAEEFFELLKWLLMALSVPVFFLLGTPFIESSLRNLKLKRTLDADMLITLGVVVAFLVSLYNTVIASGPVYYETAIGILVVVSGGRYLEARARAKSMKALNALETTSKPEAHVLRPNGDIENVRPDQLSVGAVILVRPGESIPIDATIINGEANIGEAVLTGESKPTLRKVGDELRSGALNYDGVLLMKVVRPESESYLATVSRLIDSARLSRTSIEATADRIARIAVPLIMLVAIGSFIYWWSAADLHTAFLTSLSVLLIACPCALGIATPAALWVALAESSRRGILFRSFSALERLAHVQHIFFDKTGTLTKGAPQIIRETLHTDLTASISRKEVLSMVQAVSSLSNHPLASALAGFLPKNGFSPNDVTHFRELPSQGIEAHINGVYLRLGKQRFVDPKITDPESDATAVWCLVKRGDERTILEFQFEDLILTDAEVALQKLQQAKYDVTILSGDKNQVVVRLSNKINIPALGELTPEDKLQIVHNTPRSAFVGDGINDAAAIAAADVGIALSHASDLARQDADVVIFDHAIERIPQVLAYSKKTFAVIKQNLFWAFAYNGLGVIAAAIGLLNPIIAAVAMTLSSFMVIQNSLRLRGKLVQDSFNEQ